jgi:putative component of membrane protein insertase Oxa1/YidC/SpoIIIJ protein YidD
MLRYAAAGAISAYQTWLSPRKGFCCAYGTATGLWTCSSYAKKVVTEHGTLALLRALPRQFARCRKAHATLLAMAAAAGGIAMTAEQEGQENPEERKKSRGPNFDCSFDSGCDAVDLGSCVSCGPCDGL